MEIPELKTKEECVNELCKISENENRLICLDVREALSCSVSHGLTGYFEKALSEANDCNKNRNYSKLDDCLYSMQKHYRNLEVFALKMFDILTTNGFEYDENKGWMHIEK